MRLEKRKSGFSVLRNITGGIVALAILVGGGGFIAGWWDGPQQEHSAVLAKQTGVTSTPSTAKASAEPLSVTIDSLLTPVPQESNGDIAIKTTPGANCTVKAIYAGVASTDPGLAPKAADALGNAEWTWTVEASTPLGTWPVTVVCTRDGQSATAHGSIVVSEPPAH